MKDHLEPKTLLGTNFPEVLDICKAAVTLSELSIEFIKEKDGEVLSVEEVFPIVLASMNVCKNKEYFLNNLVKMDAPEAFKHFFCVKIEALRALKWWKGEVTPDQINSKAVLTALHDDASPETLELILKVLAVVIANLEEAESSLEEDLDEVGH